MCTWRGRFGGQIAGGHPKAFLWPRQPLFAVLALRERESSKVLAGLAFCEMLSEYPQAALHGRFSAGRREGSAAVCDPNPPRPFARSRLN